MANGFLHSKVCVIGAGCSGLAAIKHLLQAGVSDIVCYEKGSRLGGNWLYSPESDHASVCETTHLISSKKRSAYPDFPMPAEYPDYPSHQQVLAYLEAYSKRFGLERYIRYKAEVKKVQKTEGERWQVILADGDMAEYDYLIVANGHHSSPRHLRIEGYYLGSYLHAHDFKHNRDERFQGKRVLVVGAGNSGCDCAVEISRVAAHVGLSMRRGHYIVPKFFMGKPIDLVNAQIDKLPRWIGRPLKRIGLTLSVGDYRQYGLQRPSYQITKGHPTINSELLEKIRHGKIHPRRELLHANGKRLTFSDGLEEDYDTILAATGYNISFPFFDRDFIDYTDSTRVPLYLRIFHPQHKTLFFLGLVQPQGSVIPVSDTQAKLIANYIMGRWRLPDKLSQLAEQEADHTSKEFIAAPRHTIEVHYESYIRRLRRAMPSSAPAWKDGLPALNQSISVLS